MEYGLIFIAVALIIGFLMAWGVGANDLANIMSTTMASKAISVRHAIIVAIIFEFAGALLGGTHVTNTIRGGIINMSHLQAHPHLVIYGMLSALLAGMTWMMLASYIGMPVSITNAIVGAIVGFGSLALGFHAVYWHVVTVIAISWVCSPLLAGTAGFLLFKIIKHGVLATNDPVKNAQRYLPIFFFFVGVVLSIMIVIKDLEVEGMTLNDYHRAIIMGLAGIMTAVLGWWLSRRIYLRAKPKRFERFEYVEKLFGILMAFTACAMVFAHGSNDVAIAMGPVSAVYSVVKYHSLIQTDQWLSLGVLFVGCVGVIVGLLMYGRKVIATVGESITALTPSRAFAATIAAASTVIFSTSAGIPVSATQTLVGGVLGVGLARGIGALRLNVIRNILLSWVVTVPAAALLAIAYFELMKLLFVVFYWIIRDPVFL